MKLKETKPRNKLWTFLLVGSLWIISQLNAELPEIDLKLIPGGYFSMGDHYLEGNEDELPVHTVYVSDFMMGTYEVSKTEWVEVAAWALKNGYSDLKNAGQAGSNSKNLYNHPVTQVNWYEVVKWCNALSEWSGLDPVYKVVGEGGVVIYREGIRNNVIMDINESGYRLPTEAEWEKAARGDLVANYFPWPSSGKKGETYKDHIDADLAVYFGNSEKSTVGNNDMTFRANAYGLYHMSGNVWEWVWDLYGSDWYSNPEAISKDTQGPSSGNKRVNRGGSWNFEVNFCRVSKRLGSIPDNQSNDLGFRVCRKANEPDSQSPE